MDNDSEVKRVLIYRLGSLGDTIIALPCFHLIAKRFPRAMRVLLTNAPFHVKAPAAGLVLGGSGLVHDSIHFDPHRRGGVWRKIRELRRFKPEVVIYIGQFHRPIKGVRRDYWFFRNIIRAKRVIGFPSVDEPRRRRSDDPSLFEPESSRLARNLVALGDAAPSRRENWSLLLSESERAAARQIAGPFTAERFIACGPGTKVQAKDWGVDNWCALVERLNKQFQGYALVLVGAKEDAESAERVGKQWTGEVKNLCGKMTPRETAVILESAELFLGPDSGPMHLAVVANVPCAVPFSARDYPGPWFPAGDVHRILYRSVDCQLCGLDVCIQNDRKCLKAITVDDMFDAAVQAWRAGRRQTEDSQQLGQVGVVGIQSLDCRHLELEE